MTPPWTAHPRLWRQNPHTPPPPQPPPLPPVQDTSEWDNAKSEFFPNLCKFNGDFRLLLWVEMSSNYLSKFHIIFNKSALLPQLMNRKARKSKLEFFLCPLHPLKCFEILVFEEFVCAERKERRGCEMVSLCLVYQTLRVGLPSGLRQCHHTSMGVTIWFDSELPRVCRTSLASSEGETTWIYGENGFVRQSSLNVLCLGEHHLVNYKDTIWEPALCKIPCNNPVLWIQEP